MRFLVIEDDAIIGAHIVHGLAQRDIAADLVNSAGAAISQLRALPYDGIVLDRMLPDMPGTTLLGELRDNGEAVPPVLMLSALGTVGDRVAGLEAGADDYLAKPFSMTELVGRLQAITRRAAPRADALGLVVGRLVLDPSSHSVAYAESSLQLNRKLFSLLAHMMRHADRVVTRDMLIQDVWGYAFAPSTNIVESNMSRLRSRLAQIGPDPIETLRGTGYVLRSHLCK